jgi:hypothetical protein
MFTYKFTQKKNLIFNIYMGNNNILIHILDKYLIIEFDTKLC